MATSLPNMKRKEKRIICPKCGKEGSLHLKQAWGRKGKFYYWYVAHYLGMNGKTSKLKWCYVQRYEDELLRRYPNFCRMKINRFLLRMDYRLDHGELYFSRQRLRRMREHFRKRGVHGLYTL